MMSTMIGWFAIGLAAGLSLGMAATGQEIGGRQSLGIQFSVSPDSSHILIGHAEQRRVLTLGFDYSHRLFGGNKIRFDYDGSVSPLFLERDPTISGKVATFANGSQEILPSGPVRVVDVRANLGLTEDPGGGLVPFYPLSRGTEESYAATIAPLGFRLTGTPNRHLRPTLSGDAGLVLSKRDLIVDQTSRLNFQFSLGPGVEFFPTPDTSIRLDYLLRHISNANISYVNPGMDSGVFRVTWSRHPKKRE